VRRRNLLQQNPGETPDHYVALCAPHDDNENTVFLERSEGTVMRYPVHCKYGLHSFVFQRSTPCDVGIYYKKTYKLQIITSRSALLMMTVGKENTVFLYIRAPKYTLNIS